MGCIDDQTDIMFTTERQHPLCIERSVYPLPMMQGDVLLTRLRAVIIGVTPLFQHFYSLSALCRSSEYQYHLIDILHNDRKS